MSSGSGARVVQRRAPTACAIRPQFGSPPFRAALTSGESATARAARTTVSSLAAVHDHAADALRALAVAHDLQREPAQQHVERLAEAQLVLGLGLDAHAARAGGHEDRRVVGGELPVDRDAVEGALHAHAEQQVGGLGAPARRPSGRSRASSRSAGEIIPAPFACAHSRTVPDGSSTSSAAFFGNASVVRIASPKRAVAVRRQLATRAAGCRGSPCRCRAARRSRRWRRRRPRSSGTPATIAAAPCMRAASSSPRRPVAAFALPELATTARMPAEPAALLAEQHRRGEHARAREARGADRVRRVGDEQAEVAAARGLEAAGDAGGAEAGRQPAVAARSRGRARRPSAMRSVTAPRSRRGRTSG